MTAHFSQVPLVLHPACSAGPVRSITASGLLEAGGRITLDYELHGELQKLRLPALVAAPTRRDGLWQHSCFELFARRGGAPQYLEFNFSPAGDWAAYAFDGYRSRQLPHPPATSDVQLGHLDTGVLKLRACTVLPEPLPGSGAPGRWQINVAAVLETRAGELSYWALRHPQPRPDFHDAAGFTISLLSPRSGAA
jgi:hypothetical protein